VNNLTSDISAAPVLLYLGDLQVGDRFTSAEHLLDEAQIKVFALQFDPPAFPFGP